MLAITESEVDRARKEMDLCCVIIATLIPIYTHLYWIRMGLMLFQCTTFFGKEREIADKMKASQMILVENYTYFDVERRITFLAFRHKSVPKFRQQVNNIDVGFRLIRLLAPKYRVSLCLIVLDFLILRKFPTLIPKWEARDGLIQVK